VDISREEAVEASTTYGTTPSGKTTSGATTSGETAPEGAGTARGNALQRRIAAAMEGAAAAGMADEAEGEEAVVAGMEEVQEVVVVQEEEVVVARGFLAQVAALVERELLTEAEGDALYARLDEGDTRVMAAHTFARSRAVARSGSGEEGDAVLDMQALLVKEAPPEETEGTSIAPLVKIKSDDETVVIPELPRGRVLEIEIETNWGDRHYVGLSGLELFDEKGLAIMVEDPAAQVTADARAITGNSADPRTPDNLLDGVNCTCDDLHVWLAPFTQGATHCVRVALDGESTLSMIRIWNYNTSRIHAARGARHLTLRLDSVAIFRGEVGQAPGEVKSAEASAEVILFTRGSEPCTLNPEP